MVVVGAGPAGATAALNLAPTRRTLLVDRWAAPRPRVGESLPGAAHRLMIDMGLWDGFIADGHAPRHVHRGAWGGPEPVERHSLGDPDGHGWHLDRVRFEQRLRATAIVRGAAQAAPARLITLDRDGSGWRMGLAHAGGVTEVWARLVIDASGRSSRLLSGHGARRRMEDRLVCAWVRTAGGALPAGVTQIEAEADGWWYAAPLPGGEALLAFHTDADLPAARAVRTSGGLLARARSLPMLGQLFGSTPDITSDGYCTARGARLEQAAGEGWLACGDAALAFDPLSAQGLFNALYTGLAAAETADRMLEGDAGAGAEYTADVNRVWAAYKAHHAAWYGMEQRWTDRPFWDRRRAATA